MTPTREGSAAYHPPPEARPSQEWHGNEWRCESAKDWSWQIKLWLIVANQVKLLQAAMAVLSREGMAWRIG